MPDDIGALRAAFQALTDRVNIMATALENLTSAVSNETTVEASAIALIQGLAGEVKKNANDPGAIQALADQITASSNALAAAVGANTSATSGATGATGATGA